MLSLSDDNQSEVIEAFNSTSRYLDDLLNINNTVGIKCEKMRKEPFFMEEKQTLLYHAYRTKFRSH